ncbi:MAG TPA: phage holin family protein [Verrucomicrobiae bacterium]|nr:phage holin family protein [Verrucomicrobiae bacterium]
MSPKLKKFLQSWIINTAAVLVAVSILPGIRYDTPLDLFVASLLLGILNAFVRPILLLVALPLLIFTLGTFIFVINALLLYFVGAILQGFHVDSFWWAFGGALIISIVSLVLNSLTGRGATRVEFHRNRRPPPPSDKPGGDGPVIDV